MFRLIQILFFLTTPVACATSTFWIDCSTKLYAYPFGLDDQEIVKEMLDEAYLQQYIDARRAVVEDAERLRANRLASTVNLDSMTDEELRAHAESLFNDAATIREAKGIAVPRSTDEARFYIVIDLFIESGREIEADYDPPPRFMNASLSTCEIDTSITQRVVDRTLEKLESLTTGGT